MGLAGSLVAMAAAGLEPPNHFIHSSASSESSQQESLGSGEEGEGGERGREGTGRREDLLGLPQRPGLSLMLLWGLWIEWRLVASSSSGQDSWSTGSQLRGAASVSQSDPVGSVL